MPFIFVKSLPFEPKKNIPAIVSAISKDFSTNMEIDLEHIHTVWQYIPPSYYAKGAKTVKVQDFSTHPILVELLVPDIHQQAAIRKMLKSVAESLQRHVEIPIEQIFIHCRLAHSGTVFDGGDIVSW